MVSMLFRQVAKEGRRLPAAKEDAREDGSELAGLADSSGVASPELRALGEAGDSESTGEVMYEPGPCTL
jgi:hypothetical protein